MSAHRHVRAHSAKVRRTIVAAVLAAGSGAGIVALAAPASAAGPWFVAPATASPAGNNLNSCLSAATPCATVTGVLAKSTFGTGDTINVAAGTYTDRPAFTAKTANVVGAGAATTIFNGSNAASTMTANIGNTATLTLSNLTLTGGKAANGGGLAITTGKVVLNGVNVTSSTATNAGGAVALLPAAGTLTITGGTMSGNSATTGGGAIYNAGTLSMTGTTLSGNSSASGGALYEQTSGNASITNGSIASNTGTSVAGGIYNVGTALSVNGTSITGNSSPLGGAAATAGGTFTGATISNNTSSNQGGAIWQNTQTLTINGGTVISGNTATASGGGIFVNQGTTNVSGGSSIDHNTAANGGGVYQSTGALTVNGSSLVSNTAGNQGGGLYSNAGTVNLTNATTNANKATALGGATVIISGTASITGGTMSSNTALNGGALYTGGTTTIDGTTFTSNAANGGTTANGGNAGAIYDAAGLTVKNATFNGNKAVANTNAAPGVAGYGGAILGVSICSACAPTIAFTNTTINGDVAGTPVAGGNAAIGGAIAALGNIGAGGSNTVITATGLTLSKNVALAAGGIYTTGATSLTSSTLSANQATHASAGIGGGLYAAVSGTAPTITLDATNVLGNDGVAGGGGLVLGAGVTTVVKNGSSVGNNTGAVGAGIFNAGTLSVQGSHVDHNSASNSGGGIYSSTPVTLSGSTVDDNSAAFLGGGLSTTTTGGFTMTDGSVSGNSAFGAGGAFVSDNLTASFDGTDFIGNTSTGANFGGGAILSGGKLTVDHATLSGNTADGASGSGGAIFSGSSNENVTTTLKVSNSTITGNSSFVGSGIYAGSSKASSTNKVSISNTTVHANTATGPFGAIETTAPTSIVGSTITDNTAVPTNPFDAYGGIVAQSAGQVSLSGSVLSGNAGHQCNVAVADGGYNLNSPTASECVFSAARNDLFAAPQLGALAANGGPTQTRLPGPTSPALDKIPATTATGVTDAVSGDAITLCGSGASDQRGTSRPQGARCDIGAVEADQVLPTVDGPSAFTDTVGVAGAPQVYTSTGSPQPTLSASGLPSGVTFTDNGDGTGKITGSPSSGTGGVYTVTVKATNEAGTGTKTVTLTVNQAPGLAGPSGATYTVGQAGGPTTFTASGYPTSVLTSLGILPSGVGFTDNNDGTGSYAGTPAAGTGGTYALTVKASNGTPPDATAPFTLTVNEAPGLTGPGAATFKVGTASQSGEYTATGFPVPTISATGLPSGLSVVSTGSGKAKISGSAANGTGGLYPVTVKASNGVGTAATQATSLTVNEAPDLTGPTEARFVAGSANTIGFSSDGYPVAALTATGVPASLTFHDNGNGSATISGTAPASAIGSYDVTVTASNGQSPDAVLHLTLDVVPVLSVATSSLPNAAYHTAYSAQVMATGGQPGYSFQVVGGSLPAGLSMNQFGLITGAPSAAVGLGLYTFTVKATDSANPSQTATKVLTLRVVKGNTQTVPAPILVNFASNGDLNITIGTVEANLKGGFPLQPIANATVSFKSGTTTVCSAKTDVNGHVKCSQNPLNALLTPLKGTITATYGGDLNWNGSSGTAPLIGKGP
ncbi:MAG: beta strand repeat-containing protein [Marmoricola sp.]